MEYGRGCAFADFACSMENGTYHYEAFEVKKIVSADTSTKRKALASASGQAVKKQKG